MVRTRVQTGRSGEDLAATYLQDHHYRILYRNYTARWAEIDIIAEKDDTIVFVEVKTRTSGVKGQPYEAVTFGKLHRLLRSANLFLVKQGWQGRRVRLDVISIVLDPFALDHFENITQ